MSGWGGGWAGVGEVTGWDAPAEAAGEAAPIPTTAAGPPATANHELAAPEAATLARRPSVNTADDPLEDRDEPEAAGAADEISSASGWGTVDAAEAEAQARFWAEQQARAAASVDEAAGQASSAAAHTSEGTTGAAAPDLATHEHAGRLGAPGAAAPSGQADTVAPSSPTAASAAGEAGSAAAAAAASAPATARASGIAQPTSTDGWEGITAERAAAKAGRLRAESLASRVKFTDPDFRPDDTSLGAMGTTLEHGVPMAPPPRCEWLRARAVGRSDADDVSASGGWRVVSKASGPSFPVQGALGDCYLISAMAVVASSGAFSGGIAPGLATSEPRFGLLHARLCLGGVWNDIFVDDFVPCALVGRLPAFAHGRGSQLWPCFVEKALAKAFGGYSRLSGGRTNEGIAWLTGAPLTIVSPAVNETQEEREAEAVRTKIAMDVALFRHMDGAPPRHLGRLISSPGPHADALWDRMRSYLSSGYLVGASCGGPSASPAEHARLGLVFNHAYSVLEAFEGMGVRGLRLRNPWASRDSGAAMPGAAVLAAADPTIGRPDASGSGSEGGVFRISFDDFRRYFNGLDVCEVRPGWLVSRLAAVMPSSPSGLQGCGYFPAFEIAVEGGTGTAGAAGEGRKACVSLWQAGHRERQARFTRTLLPDEQPDDDWRVPPADAVPGSKGLGPDRRRPQKRGHSVSLAIVACDAGGGSAEHGIPPELGAAVRASHGWHRFPDPEAGAAAAGWPHPLLGPARRAVDSEGAAPTLLASTIATGRGVHFSHVVLRPGRRYLAVPLVASTLYPGCRRWTETVCSVHAEGSGATIRRVGVPARDVAAILFERAHRMATRVTVVRASDEELRDDPGAGCFWYKLAGEKGFTYLVENRLRRTVEVTTQIKNGQNIMLSRGHTPEAAAVFSGKRLSSETAAFVDRLGPRTRMVVVLGSVVRLATPGGGPAAAMSWSDPDPTASVCGPGRAPGHVPVAHGLHAAIPCVE